MLVARTLTCISSGAPEKRRSEARKHFRNAALAESIAVVATTAKLAFLPWNGCEVPGSPYSTGVKGTPGRDCQKVYQPAAAAEARAVARLRQEQAPGLVQEAREAEDISTTRQAVRAALSDELRQRNKDFVDSAWQSLE